MEIEQDNQAHGALIVAQDSITMSKGQQAPLTLVRQPLTRPLQIADFTPSAAL